MMFWSVKFSVLMAIKIPYLKMITALFETCRRIKSICSNNLKGMVVLWRCLKYVMYIKHNGMEFNAGIGCILFIVL